MAGQADVRLCKLGGSWLLAKWMYQALFFSLSSQRSKETKKKGTWSQVTASLRKQPTFGNATRFPRQMTSEKFHTVDVSLPRSDLVNASDWSCFMGHLIEPIRSTNKIWVVMRPQHRISVLLPQTSFGGETGGRVTKCWLFPPHVSKCSATWLKPGKLVRDKCRLHTCRLAGKQGKSCCETL